MDDTEETTRSTQLADLRWALDFIKSNPALPVPTFEVMHLSSATQVAAFLSNGAGNSFVFTAPKTQPDAGYRYITRHIGDATMVATADVRFLGRTEFSPFTQDEIVAAAAAEQVTP